MWMKLARPRWSCPSYVVYSHELSRLRTDTCTTHDPCYGRMFQNGVGQCDRPSCMHTWDDDIEAIAQCQIFYDMNLHVLRVCSMPWCWCWKSPSQSKVETQTATKTQMITMHVSSNHDHDVNFTCRCDTLKREDRSLSSVRCGRGESYSRSTVSRERQRSWSDLTLPACFDSCATCTQLPRPSCGGHVAINWKYKTRRISLLCQSPFFLARVKKVFAWQARQKTTRELQWASQLLDLWRTLAGNSSESASLWTTTFVCGLWWVHVTITTCVRIRTLQMHFFLRCGCIIRSSSGLRDVVKCEALSGDLRWGGGVILQYPNLQSRNREKNLLKIGHDN